MNTVLGAGRSRLFRGTRHRICAAVLCSGNTQTDRPLVASGNRTVAEPCWHRHCMSHSGVSPSAATRSGSPAGPDRLGEASFRHSAVSRGISPVSETCRGRRYVPVAACPLYCQSGWVVARKPHPLSGAVETCRPDHSSFTARKSFCVNVLNRPETVGDVALVRRLPSDEFEPLRATDA